MTLPPAPMFAVSALLQGRLRRLVAAPIVYVLPHAREDTRDAVEMRGYAFIPGPGIEQGLIQQLIREMWNVGDTLLRKALLTPDSARGHEHQLGTRFGGLFGIRGGREALRQGNACQLQESSATHANPVLPFRVYMVCGLRRRRVLTQHPLLP
jgi:hypothetical protein